MAGSKLAIGIEKLVNNLAKLLGKFQVGANKILWGRANVQPATTVTFTPPPSPTEAGKLTYTTNVPTAPSDTAQDGSRFRSFAQSGLFNILNALNSVDLCQVLSYAYDNINLKKRPRPANPQGLEKLFYNIQDVAGVIVTQIDKYTAYPNEFIGSFLGVGPNATPPVIAVEQKDAPIQGGTAVQKYNTFFLMQAIKETLVFGNSPNSLLTPEEINLLTSVPGVADKINFLRDFLGTIDQYADYRQISDERLQYLITQINRVRAVCVAIQALNFSDPRAAANAVANYLGVDIRSQIAKLNKYVDITKIIPTLKAVNNSLQSFIRIANQIQGIINLGQFFIKLAILFVKVFKFIIAFFGALPIPLIFSTAGLQTVIQDAKDKAKDESSGMIRVLRSINALMSVLSVFVTYLLVNTTELLARLETLLIKLRGCEAMKNSDVLYELEKTYVDLTNLKDRLETYVINLESKTSPDTAQFGKYQIKVIDEEVVETTVRNRRRRGVALDMNGSIVAESDLTFATNTAIIIEEVKQKLVSLGLVQPTIPKLDADSLAVITQSLDYLDNNDVLDDNLNLSEQEIEGPDNLDENKGLGLQAFVNNLKGGRRLRKRMRKMLAKNLRETSAEIRKTDNTGQFTQTANNQSRQANQLEIANLRDQIKEWQAQIAIALTQGPVGYAIVADRRQKIVVANKRILELQRGG